MRHRWTLLALGSAIDQESNNLSIFNIIDGIKFQTHIADLQAIPITFQVLSLWELESNETSFLGIQKLILLAPDGESLHEHELGIDLTHHRRLRTKVVFQGLPLHGTGLYTFHILYQSADATDWITVDVVPFDVQIEYGKEE